MTVDSELRISVAVITAADVHSAGQRPEQWAGQHRDEVRAAVTQHGAVLVRGLELSDAGQVEAVARTLTDELMAEREGFTSRRMYSPGVYSSATWPDDVPMCMHHELSYARTFPGTMMFACLAPATEGGEIQLASAAAMAEALPRDHFAGGWQVIRNYHPETGSTWQEAFGTDDPSVAEEFCAANDIAIEWHDNGVPRTRQSRPAVLTHPVTGSRCWFNQIAFLNEWTMAEEIREYLVWEYGPDGLPFNTAHADGTPITSSTVEELNALYDKHAVTVQWQAGDLLVVDNIATAHSRRGFTGKREVVVAMGDPVDRASLG